ncbi:MAG: hypothetical protein AAFU54_14660 [Chloroflexota bacterium]
MAKTDRVRWFKYWDGIPFVLFIFEVVLAGFPIIAYMIAEARHGIRNDNEPLTFVTSSFVVVLYTSLVLVSNFKEKRKMERFGGGDLFIYSATVTYGLALTVVLFSFIVEPAETSSSISFGFDRLSLEVSLAPSTEDQTLWRQWGFHLLFVLTVTISGVLRGVYIWRDPPPAQQPDIANNKQA